MKKKLLLSRNTNPFLSIMGIVYLICIALFDGHCQSGKIRVDINSVYQSEVERLLLPRNSMLTKTSLIAAFLVHPMGDPDYSICLKDSAQQYFMELRSLDQNLWRELLTGYMGKRSQSVSLKSYIYSRSVSKGFKRKMIKAFEIINPVKENPDLVVLYDNTTYEFRWVKNRKMKKVHIAYDLKANSYESGLIKLMSQISGDIRNNSFKGVKYFEQHK